MKTIDTLSAAAKAASKAETAARIAYHACEMAQPFDREAYEKATTALSDACVAEHVANEAYDAAVAAAEGPTEPAQQK